jgi:hypothetical protein
VQVLALRQEQEQPDAESMVGEFAVESEQLLVQLKEQPLEQQLEQQRSEQEPV